MPVSDTYGTVYRPWLTEIAGNSPQVCPTTESVTLRCVVSMLFVTLSWNRVLFSVISLIEYNSHSVTLHAETVCVSGTTSCVGPSQDHSGICRLIRPPSLTTTYYIRHITSWGAYFSENLYLYQLSHPTMNCESQWFVSRCTIRCLSPVRLNPKSSTGFQEWISHCSNTRCT